MPDLLNLEDRLRADLRAVAGPVTANDALDRLVRTRRDRGRRRRASLVAVAASLALVAGVVVVLRSGDGPGSESVRATAPEQTTTTLTDLSGGTWADIPPAPLSLRRGAASVWAGDRLVVWSGAVCETVCRARSGYPADADRRTDGATWDPVTGDWTPMAPPSGGDTVLLAGGFAVWTGEEVVFGPVGPADAGVRQQARWLPKLVAYDPASDTWRDVPSVVPGVIGEILGPRIALEQARWQAVAAAGRIVVTAFGSTASNPADAPEYRQGAVASIDPRTGETTPPAVLVDLGDGEGEALLASAGDQVLVSWAARLFLLDPRTGYGDPVAAPPHPSILERTPIWTGGELVYALDRYGEHQGGAVAYRPSSDDWRDLPPTDLVDPLARVGSIGGFGSPPAVWTGSVVVGFGASFDPASGAWVSVSPPSTDPEVRVSYELIAWTGEELIVFGGDRYGCPANAECDVDLGAEELDGRRYRS